MLFSFTEYIWLYFMTLNHHYLWLFGSSEVLVNIDVILMGMKFLCRININKAFITNVLIFGPKFVIVKLEKRYFYFDFIDVLLVHMFELKPYLFHIEPVRYMKSLSKPTWIFLQGYGCWKSWNYLKHLFFTILYKYSHLTSYV